MAHEAVAGVIFFNNSGYLGMCGHGLMGVVATLAYADRIQSGEHLFETPVGDVRARLATDGSISIDNVVSYRVSKNVAVQGSGIGEFIGDVAWGGNWFFITRCDLPPRLSAVPHLTDLALAIRGALVEQGVTGAGGAVIDHIEFVGPPSDPVKADARNFVLCPGGQYDRSPCGTGTSAKLACLAADGKLAEGRVWRQESMLGTIFEGRYRAVEGGVLPTITGRSYVNADLRLVLDPADPFRFGIPPQTPL